jgi:hypothetical protein
VSFALHICNIPIQFEYSTSNLDTQLFSYHCKKLNAYVREKGLLFFCDCVLIRSVVKSIDIQLKLIKTSRLRPRSRHVAPDMNAKFTGEDSHLEAGPREGRVKSTCRRPSASGSASLCRHSNNGAPPSSLCPR